MVEGTLHGGWQLCGGGGCGKQSERRVDPIPLELACKGGNLVGTFRGNGGGPLRAAVFAATIVLALSPARLAAGSGALWAPSISATNTVVSSPTSGGGYPENPPVAGGCVGPSSGNFNANHSESELTVKPGSEQIVAPSKFFSHKFSTGYTLYPPTYNLNYPPHSNKPN